MHHIFFFRLILLKKLNDVSDVSVVARNETKSDDK